VAWRRVVYVLLAKKHGDQNLVGNRRDIALMAQCLKMVLRVLKLHVYARMAGRVDRAQCGFVRGMGAQDVALLASLLLQGGRWEKRMVYLLFVDIRKFFPAIDRTNLTFAELFHGVPTEVTQLVAAIFGEMMGVYDSAHGTCEEFGIYMGALMGCVLSPDRAKLILDTVVVAIRLHTRGVLPWGRGVRGVVRFAGGVGSVVRVGGGERLPAWGGGDGEDRCEWGPVGGRSPCGRRRPGVAAIERGGGALYGGGAAVRARGHSTLGQRQREGGAGEGGEAVYVVH